MTFLEMNNAGLDATDRVRNEIQSAFQQAYDILKTAKRIETLSNSTHLPNLEIAMANFQEPAKTSQPSKSTGKVQDPRDPRDPKDSEIFADSKDSKNSNLYDYACQTENCKTNDSRYEQYITRDANGRVLHTAQSVPKYEYDQQGNLAKVTIHEGRWLGDLLTGADMFKPIVYVRGADGKWRYSDDGKEVEVQTIDVDQHTGECTIRYQHAIRHLHANGTSHTTDSTGERLMSTQTSTEGRSYTYDAQGNLQEVHYYGPKSGPFGCSWVDKWVRQEDGSWVNIKDGKPTGRRLKDIQCTPDGTHIEVEYPCTVNLFRLEPGRKK